MKNGFYTALIQDFGKLGNGIKRRFAVSYAAGLIISSK